MTKLDENSLDIKVFCKSCKIWFDKVVLINVSNSKIKVLTHFAKYLAGGLMDMGN